jgi:hypothetical protein
MRRRLKKTNNLFIGVMAIILPFFVFEELFSGYFLTLDVRKWPEVTGKIEKSRIISSKSINLTANKKNKKHEKSIIYEFDIIYKYQISGKVYSSNLVHPINKTKSSSFAQLEYLLKKYPEGASVPVYYSPEENGLAYLENKVSKENQLHFFLCFILTPLGGIFLVYRFIRKKIQAT